MSEKKNPEEPESPDEEPAGNEERAQAGATRSRLKDLGSGLGAAFTKLKGEYADSDLKRQVEEYASQTKQFLDEKGITDKAAEAYQTTQEHLDTVSGARLLQLVEERLTLQEKYNDILATKLEELIQRVEKLEHREGRSGPE